MPNNINIIMKMIVSTIFFSFIVIILASFLLYSFTILFLERGEEGREVQIDREIDR